MGSKKGTIKRFQKMNFGLILTKPERFNLGVPPLALVSVDTVIHSRGAIGVGLSSSTPRHGAGSFSFQVPPLHRACGVLTFYPSRSSAAIRPKCRSLFGHNGSTQYLRFLIEQVFRATCNLFAITFFTCNRSNP